MTFRRVRPNALPDEIDHRDTGCTLSPSCLHCPYPACRYDQPAGADSFTAQNRLDSVARLASDPRYTRDAIASILGVSRRQVFRYLRRLSHGTNHPDSTRHPHPQRPPTRLQR